MPTFSSNPLRSTAAHQTLRKYPAIFGIPFVLLIVGASYGLSAFTQTKYDLQDQKVKSVCPFLFHILQTIPAHLLVTQVNKEEELGLRKQKRKFDIREEYFVCVPLSGPNIHNQHTRSCNSV